MRFRSKRNQDGVSLTGLIVALIIVGAIAMVGMKVVPTVMEYQSIKKAVASAKNAGTSEREIRMAFDKIASAGYIDSIKGSDLEIVRTNNELEVSFAYEKKIPLFGPASLVIDYEGTTARAPARKDSRLKNT